MYKALVLAAALTTTVTALVLMSPASSRQAQAQSSDPFTIAEDSLFMDSGDGEFSAPLPDAEPAPAPEAPKKEKGKKGAKAAKPEPRKPASDETTDAGPGSLDDLDMGTPAEASTEMKEETGFVAAPSEPAAEEAAAPAQEEAPPKKLPKKKKPSKVASSGGKGRFASTRDACPMMREPASDAEKMTTVRTDIKIWVEEVDESWVRAYNKAGEPGYVSKDCVE